MNQQTALAERIESRIDKEVMGGLALASGGATMTVVPRSMGEVMEFAKMMAISGIAVRPAFRGQPGACLAIAMQALRWGMDPFAVSNKAYVVKNKSGDEQIAFEAQLVHAVVNERAPLQKRLQPIYTGQGPTRVCKISGLLKGETEPHEYESPEFAKIQPKNSPLWTTDPDQQLFYYSVRAWARRNVPEVLLGVYTADEMEQGPEYARDVTPPARPTRGGVAAASAQATDDGGAAEPAKPTLEFVDANGEFIAYVDPVAYADAFITEMRRAPREIDVQGIWGTNSPSLDALRVVGPEGEKLAEEIHAAYREELDAKKKAEHKSAAASEPAKAEPEPVDQPDQLPVDETPATRPDDSQALYDELVGEVNAAKDAKAIHDWHRDRAEHLKILKAGAQKLYEDLVTRANARLAKFNGKK